MISPFGCPLGISNNVGTLNFYPSTLNLFFPDPTLNKSLTVTSCSSFKLGSHFPFLPCPFLVSKFYYFALQNKYQRLPFSFQLLCYNLGGKNQYFSAGCSPCIPGSLALECVLLTTSVNCLLSSSHCT